MSKKKKRIGVEGNETTLSNNPFGALDSSGLAQAPTSAPSAPIASEPAKKKSRGRVDIVRQRAAGGGGWMTVAKNFVGISQEEKNDLKKRIQKRCGVGGSLKNGQIEIQGDKREEMKTVLEAAGFRVVFAGG